MNYIIKSFIDLVGFYYQSQCIHEVGSESYEVLLIAS